MDTNQRVKKQSSLIARACLPHAARRLALATTFSLLLSASSFSQGRDPYGGTLDLSCTYPPPNGATQSLVSIRQDNGTPGAAGTVVTAVVNDGTQYQPYEIVFATGTGSALDNAQIPGAYFLITSVAGNTLTMTAPSSASVPQVNGKGTLFWARFYSQKLTDANGNQRWFLCTPQGHAYFFIGVFEADLTLLNATDYQGINKLTLLQKKYANNPISGHYTENWAYWQARRALAWNFTGWDSGENSVLAPMNKDTNWNTAFGVNYIPLRLPTVSNDQLASRYPTTNKLNFYAPGYVKGFLYSFKSSTSSHYCRGGVDVADPTWALYLSRSWKDTSNANHIWSPYYSGQLNEDFVTWIPGDEQDDESGLGDGPDLPSMIFGDFIQNMGQKDYVQSWLALVTTPVQYAKDYNRLNIHAYYSASVDPVYNNAANSYGIPAGPSGTFYTKLEMARWLQGQTDEMLNATAARSGSTVTVATADTAEPFVHGEDVDLSGCSDAIFNGTSLKLLSAGGAQLTLTLAGAGASATGCKVTTSAARATRSGSTVTLTFPGPHNFIPGEVITVAGCNAADLNSVAGTGVAVTSVTVTTLTYALAGASSSGSGCIVTSGPGYLSIAQLNSAWSTAGYVGNYDTFGSDAVTHADTICSGLWNGTLSTCSGTLLNVPFTPFSAAVYVNGQLVGGDDALGAIAGTPTATDHLLDSGTYITSWAANSTNPSGVTLALGTKFLDSHGNIEMVIACAGQCKTGATQPVWPTVPGTQTTDGTLTREVDEFNTTTGVYTLLLSSPPPSGASVTIQYQTNGWGAGFGLLDEDGKCPSRGASGCWVPVSSGSGVSSNGIESLSIPSTDTQATVVSRTSGVTTVTAPNTFSAGQNVEVYDTLDTSYEGIFTIASANSASFTYNQPGQPDAAASTSCVAQPGDASGLIPGGSLCFGFAAIPSPLKTDLENFNFHYFKRYACQIYHALKDASPDLLVSPSINQIQGDESSARWSAFFPTSWYTDLLYTMNTSIDPNGLLGSFNYRQQMALYARDQARDAPWIDGFCLRADGAVGSSYLAASRAIRTHAVPSPTAVLPRKPSKRPPIATSSALGRAPAFPAAALMPALAPWPDSTTGMIGTMIRLRATGA